jgi:hypothetical protein
LSLTEWVELGAIAQLLLRVLHYANNGVHVRIALPTAPRLQGETVQHVTALQFKGAPDFNRRLRQQTMGSVGPAGFLLADDAEMYERSHRGVQEKNPEWVYLGAAATANAPTNTATASATPPTTCVRVACGNTTAH